MSRPATITTGAKRFISFPDLRLGPPKLGTGPICDGVSCRLRRNGARRQRDGVLLARPGQRERFEQRRPITALRRLYSDLEQLTDLLHAQKLALHPRDGAHAYTQLLSDQALPGGRTVAGVVPENRPKDGPLRTRLLWSTFLILALTSATAGCGTTTTHVIETVVTAQPTTTTSPSVTFSMPPTPGGSSCAIQLSGHTAIVIFTSRSVDVSSACQTLIQVQASEGQLWSLGSLPAGGPPAMGDSQVCSLTDSSGDAQAVVWDSGGATYGQGECTSLISGGWTEQSSP
jgi:hypothetical protein